MSLVNEATGYRSCRCDGALDGGETRRVVLEEVEEVAAGRPEAFRFLSEIELFPCCGAKASLPDTERRNFVPLHNIVPIYSRQSPDTLGSV